MGTVLFVFIAIAFGLLLFTSMQDKIPDELSFLRSTPPEAVVVGAQTGARAFSYEGWKVRQSGQAVELVKPLTGRLEANGSTFDSPELGVLCNAGKLDVRIDTRLAVTGTAMTPVLFGSKTASSWQKGTGRNIFPVEPAALVRQLVAASGPVSISLSYVDLGMQTLALDTTGLKALVEKLPASCR